MKNFKSLRSNPLKNIEVVGSAVIENTNGEILLVRSPKWRNKWVMPGGHIEVGESIEEGILREAREEVGLKLKSSGVICYGELINSKDFYRPAHFIYFDIYCRTQDTRIQLDKKELSAFLWINPKGALQYDCAESYSKTIQEFLRYKGLI